MLLDGLAIAATRLSDISTGGAFVESVNELPVGTLLRLRFPVADRVVDVGGQIVQSMPQFGFGVRFTDLAPEDAAAIKALVNEAE
jgi:hypothetical protein